MYRLQLDFFIKNKIFCAAMKMSCWNFKAQISQFDLGKQHYVFVQTFVAFRQWHLRRVSRANHPV